ncbi:hypothetical protein [Chryseolinea lacunae]|uniref:Transporter n=1 Tax=Chryseolinea lacunae TaxID=2801331 RepID=A0ABS1KX32_9BACT|nr:hypothetical protein [Chryseolinea lacunae]MBL0743858.1 hypothetical protein [Chryseolinea lacunae]
MKATGSIVVLLLIACANLHAQNIDQDKLLRMRDSLDNLLVINPSASAILVKRRELELYSYNSFLSSKQFNDKTGSNANLAGKQLLFNSLFQINYGASRNRRFNIGVDVNFRAYRYDIDKNSQVISLFKDNPGNERSVTYVGPRVRLQPFRRANNFTFQSYVWIPVAQKELQTSLGSNKVNWGNTLFFYKYFSPKLGIFTQLNFAFAFPSGNSETGSKTEFYLPASVSLSYVATRKDLLFATLSYSWTNTDVSHVTEGADSDFVQYGAGYQHLFSKHFFVNASYTGTLMARNYGMWSGVNVCVRYVF